VDSEITSLIDQVNQRLTDRGETITLLNPGQLAWPIDPGRGITAYFHDPTYPFRKIFEHPAIDIRAAHGTAVTAAGDGVVAIARRLDWVRNSKGDILWSAYNFVTIVHGGNLATVYGHLSQVAVNEGDTVRRGQVIGRSGATPGTAGAGRLTTGPHLHFEVRVNGIPDDPLKYLPAL
jgi:murein DD-endopeptidase MepM/ murein hydrolase activator NlpD